MILKLVHQRQDDELSYALGKQGSTRKKLLGSQGRLQRIKTASACFAP